MRWLDRLRGNPLPWLLESENPSVRYRALRDLLDRPLDDPDVQGALEAIPASPPVAELVAAQHRDGYWTKRDYYLPRHSGTFWTLIVLADLGLTAEHERIRQACDYMFTFQRDHGAFRRRRRIRGKGIVWDPRAELCTQARIVRFLIQFGYGQDPRLRAAVDWIVSNQLSDGMWDCGGGQRPGCLRATLDVLSVASVYPTLAAHPAIARAAAVVAGLLMEPGMARYHVGLDWTTLQYPYFDYSLLSALDTLARLGYTVEHPKIAAAAEFLLTRQLSDGAWPVDHIPRDPPFDVGQPGEPNKWLTLDAMRVIKHLDGW